MALSSPDLRIRLLAARQHSAVTARQSLQCGLSLHDVRTRCRRGEWVPVFRGAYLVDADLYGGEVPRAAQLSAVLLLHGPHAVLGLATAAELHGVQGLPQTAAPVDVILPPGLERWQRSGIRVHWWPLHPGEVVEVDGLRATSVPRTLADLVGRLDRVDALCILDSALHLRLLTVADLPTVTSTAAGRPGAAQLHALLPLADGRAASPLETRVRLACIDGCVAPDTLQHPVLDAWGHLLGYADLAWLRRARPLLGEADGAAVHDRAEALYRDRRRQNDFAKAGCDVLRFTWSDALRPPYVASVVRSMLHQ